MNKILLITLISCIASFELNAQNNIMLNINHKLSDVDFELNEAAKNNMDHDFKITRLEYYISEISLLHDGGVETKIEDLWILVDAARETEVDLGQYDITSVEKIVFHIGVDRDHNHLDPSSYPSSHPLAPKFPSMHWGWTAGYRFVALEGHGGENLNQLVQLHGLGDDNYFTSEIDLDATAENDIISINIDADYTKALEDISVNSGVIVHGDNLQAQQCLENFRDYVFSPSSITSSIVKTDEINEFSVFPNPIVNGVSSIKLDIEETANKYDLSIWSIEGRQLDYIHNVVDKQNIDLSNQPSGMYFINLITDGKMIMSEKVIIK